MNNKTKQQDDPFARDSFGMRRMTRWQLLGITIVTVAVIAAAAVYLLYPGANG